MKKRLCQISNVINNGSQAYAFAADTETGETIFIRSSFIAANDINQDDVGSNFYCYAEVQGEDTTKGPVLFTFLRWEGEDDERAEIKRLTEQLDAANSQLEQVRAIINTDAANDD
jgi:hypothetical protein